MKKFARLLMSKTAIIATLAFLQLFLLIAIVFVSSTRGPYIYLGITLLSALLCMGLISDDKINQAYKMMWLSIIVLLPITGFLFYVLWGAHSNKKIYLSYKWAETASDITPYKTNDYVDFEKSFGRFSRNARYLTSLADAPLFSGNDVTYFRSGEEFFPIFLAELKKARKTIFMEYFIIAEGYMWDSILEVLKQKAQSGVDVRVMYDGFGSLLRLPDSYEKKLKKYGIKCQVFNPLKTFSSPSKYRFLNNRDHRKVCVIDSETGFSGGLNLADEYINRTHPYGVWKDNAFMVRGPGVLGLTSIFMTNWAYSTGKKEDLQQYIPKKVYESSEYIQSFYDSPLDYENISQTVYTNILSLAQDYVYITTPYLIIDSIMTNALVSAAKSGIDVRIILPGIPDKFLVNQITKSYYRVLLENKVRIFEYTPGFIHSKTYVSDNIISVAGTANMDFRSLYLHFENCTVFYGRETAADLKNDFIDTLASCREITLRDVAATPVRYKILQGFTRFFAPLM